MLERSQGRSNTLGILPEVECQSANFGTLALYVAWHSGTLALSILKSSAACILRRKDKSATWHSTPEIGQSAMRHSTTERSLPNFFTCLAKASGRRVELDRFRQRRPRLRTSRALDARWRYA